MVVVVANIWSQVPRQRIVIRRSKEIACCECSPGKSKYWTKFLLHGAGSKATLGRLCGRTWSRDDEKARNRMTLKVQHIPTGNLKRRRRRKRNWLVLQKKEILGE